MIGTSKIKAAVQKKISGFLESVEEFYNKNGIVHPIDFSLHKNTIFQIIYPFPKEITQSSINNNCTPYKSRVKETSKPKNFPLNEQSLQGKENKRDRKQMKQDKRNEKRQKQDEEKREDEEKDLKFIKLKNQREKPQNIMKMNQILTWLKTELDNQRIPTYQALHKKACQTFGGTRIMKYCKFHQYFILQSDQQIIKRWRHCKYNKICKRKNKSIQSEQKRSESEQLQMVKPPQIKRVTRKKILQQEKFMKEFNSKNSKSLSNLKDSKIGRSLDKSNNSKKYKI